MQCYGFSSAASIWLQNYLINRRQTVFFNGSLSEEKTVCCGIPQGSCLGPLLFSIYINDLPLVLRKAKIAMYADDSTIYSSQSTVQELENVLMEELKPVIEWVTNNKLVLNISQTKSILFGTRYMLLNEPRLNIVVKDINVAQVQETKLLGIEVDNKLSWSSHIKAVVRRMGRGLSMVRRCSNMLPFNMTADVIKTVVLSQLDYCDALLAGCPASSINKLQLVQNAAARVLTRSRKYDHITSILSSLHWLPIKFRINYKVLLMTYKALNGLAPGYRSLRSLNSRILVIPRISKTTKGGRAFSHLAPKLWNGLPDIVRGSDSLSQFKTRLKTHLFSQAFT
ncbi:hypothetical protein PO909_022822 [Leuciscus waleckii]